MSLVDEGNEIAERKASTRYEYKLDKWVHDGPHDGLTSQEIYDFVSNLDYPGPTVRETLAKHGYTGSTASIDSWRRMHVTR